MTKEERQELERIRRARGRYEEESTKTEPRYKDEQKPRVWRLKLLGREIEIKVTNPNK